MLATHSSGTFDPLNLTSLMHYSAFAHNSAFRVSTFLFRSCFLFRAHFEFVFCYFSFSCLFLLPHAFAEVASLFCNAVVLYLSHSGYLSVCAHSFAAYSRQYKKKCFINICDAAKSSAIPISQYKNAFSLIDTHMHCSKIQSMRK